MTGVQTCALPIFRPAGFFWPDRDRRICRCAQICCPVDFSRFAEYFSTPLKYYFADIGLRNARLNFRQVEETHIMENIIYNDLLRRGFNVDVGVVEYFPSVDGKTTRVQLEVDFVINRGNLRYYIQSAFAINSEEKKEQERNSLKRIADSFKKIIIVRDNIVPRYDEYGIYYIGMC